MTHSGDSRSQEAPFNKREESIEVQTVSSPSGLKNGSMPGRATQKGGLTLPDY
jgi:hypothetical protein